MDEMRFLRELSEVSHRIPGGTGDIRQRVWNAIHENGVDVDDGNADDVHSSFLLGASRLLKMNVAAAVIIAAASGLIHHSLSAFMSDTFWSRALYGFYHYF